MIEFNYKEAIKQANELEDISEELYRIVNSKLKPGLNTLQGAWRGDSSHLFQKKMDELIKDISKSAKTTSSIATAVSTSAKVVKAAEDAAERIIKSGGL